MGTGRLLAETQLRRGDRAVLAARLEVSVRVLLIWVVLAVKGTCARRGRPCLSKKAQWETLRAVAQEMRRQQREELQPTCRSVVSALRTARHRVSQVRECVGRLKKRRRWLEEERRRRERVHIEVLKKHAVYAIDGTYAGKDEEGKRVVIENALDLGTREHPDLSVGGPPKGEDVVATLERAREVNGCDPLMIFSDRGPENTATVVRRHVKERMIVHVFSLTHVPEHNARCERSHQDVKAQLGIAACSKGRKLETEDWRERVEDTRCLLNSRMQRRQLGFLTAEEYARALPAWYAGPRGIDRKAFHAACEQAVEDALLGIEDIHERDLAEREAKLRTAERFGLLIRTRGDPLPTRPRYRKELWRFNYSCG